MTVVEGPGGVGDFFVRHDRRVAAICHLWCWLGPLAILPLIVRRSSASSHPLLRTVTADVLNLQIAALVPGLVFCAVLVVSPASTLVLVGLLLLFFVPCAYGYIVGIIGAVRLVRGDVWRYPVNLHPVRDD